MYLLTFYSERSIREKTLDGLTGSLKTLAADLKERMDAQQPLSTKLFIGQVAYSVALRAYKFDSLMNATKTEDLLKVYTESLEFWINQISTTILVDFKSNIHNNKENWYDNDRRSSWESKIDKRN